MNEQRRSSEDAQRQAVAKASRYLSWALRHRPEAIGLALDREGWADVDALIAAAAANGQVLDRALIERVVATSEKKRFAFSGDGARIRAVQGHSTAAVDIAFEPKEPPILLFHGTATRFVDSIRVQGLLAGARHYVHLSDNPRTARSVGERYGTPSVLAVSAGAMHESGIKFYQAENGVWLVDHVPPQYLVP